MSTLAIRPRAPAKLTGLTATNAVGGTTLKWNASPFISDQYEVWYNTSNTTSGATKLATIEANHYTATNLSTANTYYFWVRTINAVGTVGPFTTPWNYGSNFNTFYAEIYEVTSSGTVTTSINYLQCQVWYTTSGGIATSVGPSYFTSTITDRGLPYGVTVWTNPDYARVNDSNFAVCTATYDSTNLRFTMADLGVPSDATVTGIQFTLNGKTTDYTVDQLYVYLTNEINGSTAAFTFPSYTANNTAQSLVYGGSTNDFGLSTQGMRAIQQTITSANTSASTVGSSGTSVGGGVNSPTVSAYNTWYYGSYATFTPLANDVVTAACFMTCTVSGVVQGGVLLTQTLTNGGTGYTNGNYTGVSIQPTVTYTGVQLSGGTGFAAAAATIVVTNGVITTVTITNSGFGYTAGDTLSCANTSIGGAGNGFILTVNTVGGGGSISTKTLTNGGLGYGPQNTTVNVTVAGGIVTSVALNNVNGGWTTTATYTVSNAIIGGGSGSGLLVTVNTVTTSGELQVWQRTRLYDNTISADVPGGTVPMLIYANGSGGIYGNAKFIANGDDTFIAGFRGLLIPGHAYTLYLEVKKQQFSGSPTCNLTIDGTYSSTGSVATVS
jgi:hypothetical protein